MSNDESLFWCTIRISRRSPTPPNSIVNSQTLSMHAFQHLSGSYAAGRRCDKGLSQTLLYWPRARDAVATLTANWLCRWSFRARLGWFLAVSMVRYDESRPRRKHESKAARSELQSDREAKRALWTLSQGKYEGLLPHNHNCLISTTLIHAYVGQCLI